MRPAVMRDTHDAPTLVVERSGVEERRDPFAQVGAFGPEDARAVVDVQVGLGRRRRAARRRRPGGASSPRQPRTSAGAVTVRERADRSARRPGSAGRPDRRRDRRGSAGRAVRAGSARRPGVLRSWAGDLQRDHLGDGGGIAATRPLRAALGRRRWVACGRGSSRTAGRKNTTRSNRSGLSASSRHSAPAPRLTPSARVAPCRSATARRSRARSSVGPRRRAARRSGRGRGTGRRPCRPVTPLPSGRVSAMPPARPCANTVAGSPAPVARHSSSTPCGVAISSVGGSGQRRTAGRAAPG